MKRYHRQSGFILVMVLIILAIAGMLLAATARQVVRESLAAHKAMRDLQFRWARRSIRNVYFETPEAILLAASDYEAPGSTRAEWRVLLGEHDFRVVLMDEQCKVNVNALDETFDDTMLISLLQKCLGRNQWDLAITLLPHKPNETIPLSLSSRYTTYDQILKYEHPRQLYSAITNEKSDSARVTCWGDGRLNIKKCSAAATRMVLQGILSISQQRMLKTYCENNPDCTLREALLRTVDDRKARIEAGGRLTDISNCHALWIVTETNTRDWYCLYIRQAANSGPDAQEWYFEW
jgi:type II secretory pathway pseudopilin PulG